MNPVRENREKRAGCQGGKGKSGSPAWLGHGKSESAESQDKDEFCQPGFFVAVYVNCSF